MHNAAQGYQALGPPTVQASGTSPQPPVARQPLPSQRSGAHFPKNWNVARRHAFYFAGRDTRLERLFQRFVARDAVQIVAPQALVGVGGLGKTQTAAEFAYCYRSSYQAVLWARAIAKRISKQILGS